MAAKYPWSSNSGGGYPWAGGKPAGSKSVGGLLGNLVGDAGDAIMGAIPGAVETVRNPIKTAKAVAADYQHVYGPAWDVSLVDLIRNKSDRKKFATTLDRVYEHPLGPILDLATIASVGAGVALRGAAEPTVALRSPGALAGESAKVIEKPTTRKGALVDKALKKLPVETPLLGEYARYARELERLPTRDAASLRLKARPYQRAYKRLNEPERITLGLIGRGVSPAEYKSLLLRELEAGRPVEPRTLKLLDRKDVRAAFANPSPRLLDAADKARALGEAGTAILTGRGRLSAAAAEARPYLGARLASVPVKPAAVERVTVGPTPKPDVAPDALNTIGSYYGAKGQLTSGAAPGLWRETSLDRIAEFFRAGRVTTNMREQRFYMATDPSLALGQGKNKGVLLEFDAEGIQFAPERSKPGMSVARASGAEEVVARYTPQETYINNLRAMTIKAGTRTDSVTRARLKRILADLKGRGWTVTRHEDGSLTARRPAPSSLTPEKLMEAIPVGLEDALAAARSVPELRQMFDEAGRPQPFYLPDKAIPERSFFGRAGGGVGVPRNPVRKTEGINFRTGMIALAPDLLTPEYLKTVKFALNDDIHAAMMESAVKVPKGGSLPEGFIYIRRPVGKSRRPEKIGYQQKVAGDFRRQLDDLIPDDGDGPSLVTRNVDEAVEQQGHYLAVPASFAREAAGEFLRSSRAVRWFITKPTAVWRALVLNLRPAWLVNNIVGNHLLYSVRYAGRGGLAAYARMVSGKGIPKEFMDELFPEQVEGTFINTQRPGSRRKLQDAVSLGLAPLDRKVEGGLRRAATHAELRRSPAVKAALKEMPRQTRSFERAARKALDDDPLLARRVSDRVNDALGDFLNLSPTERGVLRTVAPFYAWYKAITKITFKLPLDSPGRANILAKLGTIGAEDARENLGDIPSFLLGTIGLGEGKDGLSRVYNTASANPWATVPQLRDDISGTINPFIEAPARALLGDSKYRPVSIANAVRGIVEGDKDTAASLPQYRLYQALTGSLHQGDRDKPTLYRRDPLSELLAYLGVPVKDVNRRRAEELKKRG